MKKVEIGEAVKKYSLDEELVKRAYEYFADYTASNKPKIRENSTVEIVKDYTRTTINKTVRINKIDNLIVELKKPNKSNRRSSYIQQEIYEKIASNIYQVIISKRMEQRKNSWQLIITESDLKPLHYNAKATRKGSERRNVHLLSRAQGRNTSLDFESLTNSQERLIIALSENRKNTFKVTCGAGITELLHTSELKKYEVHPQRKGIIKNKEVMYLNTTGLMEVLKNKDIQPENKKSDLEAMMQFNKTKISSY